MNKIVVDGAGTKGINLNEGASSLYFDVTTLEIVGDDINAGAEGNVSFTSGDFTLFQGAGLDVSGLADGQVANAEGRRHGWRAVGVLRNSPFN